MKLPPTLIDTALTSVKVPDLVRKRARTTMTTTRITKMTITAMAASTMPLATLILSALPAAIPSASAEHEERHGYGYGCGVGRFDDGCLAEDGGILGG